MIWFIACLVGVVFANAGAASVDDRVFGGRATTIDKFPHQVWISTGDFGVCGGSIISDKHVFTAANCVTKLEPAALKVHAGSSRISKGGEIYKVEKVHICPDFNNQTGDCDVAVLVLKSSFDMSKSIRPIEVITVKDKPKFGDVLTVTGWGVSTINKGYVETLQALDVFYMDTQACRSTYEEHRHPIGKSLFCAGPKDQGVRHTIVGVGDSGGPIINTRKQLVGIVSRGLSDLPSVYTDITEIKVRTFIESKLAFKL